MKRDVPQAAFRINAPRVVFQTVDREAIIIDFDNGAYFSAEGVGAEIWDGIARGLPVDQIRRAVSQRYAGDEQEIQKGIGQFIETLRNESLILPVDAAPAQPPAVPDAGTAEAGLRPAYAPPQLRKYTDMQDLLLLDPIHEVDEQGWPIAKDDAAG